MTQMQLNFTGNYEAPMTLTTTIHYSFILKELNNANIQYKNKWFIKPIITKLKNRLL